MQNVTVQTLQEKLQKPVPAIACIDVRSLEEYKSEHIDGVVNIPLSELHTHGNFFRNASAVYVHCQSGGRSVVACEALVRSFPHVVFYNVEGGILAWKRANLPTVTEAPGA